MSRSRPPGRSAAATPPDTRPSPVPNSTAPRSRPALPGNPRQAVVAVAADTACVLLFAVAGRDAHSSGEALLDVGRIAWPFLVGLALGWGAALRLGRGHGRSWASLTFGAIVWAAALVGGVALRLASGATAAVPFVLVAAGFLGLSLLGWRFAARICGRAIGARCCGRGVLGSGSTPALRSQPRSQPRSRSDEPGAVDQPGVGSGK